MVLNHFLWRCFWPGWHLTPATDETSAYRPGLSPRPIAPGLDPPCHRELGTATSHCQLFASPFPAMQVLETPCLNVRVRQSLACSWRHLVSSFFLLAVPSLRCDAPAIRAIATMLTTCLFSLMHLFLRRWKAFDLLPSEVCALATVVFNRCLFGTRWLGYFAPHVQFMPLSKCRT